MTAIGNSNEVQWSGSGAACRMPVIPMMVGVHRAASAEQSTLARAASPAAGFPTRSGVTEWPLRAFSVSRWSGRHLLQLVAHLNR